MALAKVTIIGLNNYSNGEIWKDFYLPEGLDKNVAIDEIIHKAGDFPLLYPDLDYMTHEIGSFCRKWERNFFMWAKAINTDYNPLYNVDVITTVTDSTTREATHELEENTTGTDNTVGNTSNNIEVSDTSNNTVESTSSEVDQSKETTEGTSSQDTTVQVAAYDSEAFKNKDKTSGSGSSSNEVNLIASKGIDTEENSTGSSTSTTEATGSSESKRNTTGNKEATGSENETITFTHSELKQGNQGMTMSGQMLRDEYISHYWNIYEVIASLFIREYCVPVYL